MSFRKDWLPRLINRLESMIDEPEWDPIDENDIQLLREFFPRPKFFIFGHARSGTTLLARLLSLHPDLHCSWQGRFFTHPGDGLSRLTSRSVVEWLRHPSLHWLDGMHKEALVARAAIDMLLEAEAAQYGKRIVGDKSPNLNHGQSIKRVQLLYPDARVLHIVRDGRDAVLSIRIADFIDRPQLLSRHDRTIRDRLERDTSAFRSGERSLFTADWLKERAADWALNVGESTRLGARHYPGRFYKLYYEGILADPMRTLRALWSFFGLDPEAVPNEEIESIMMENPKQEEHEQKAPRLVRDLPRGSQGGWRQFFTEDDMQRFHTQAGEVLAENGYPLDRVSDYPPNWPSGPVGEVNDRA